jgi:hypothetical protein
MPTPRKSKATGGKPKAASVASGSRSPGASRRATLAALEAESARQLDDLIRRRLALPIEGRMNFLRRRLPGGGSCL